MAKFGLTLVLALGLILAVSSVSQAGLCIDQATWCNDQYLGMSAVGGGFYGLHGEEYGCDYNCRLYDGSMHLTGGVAYIGLLGSLGSSCTGGDQGMTGRTNYVVSLSSMTGSGDYEYHYLSGGAPAGHGGSVTVTVAVCPGPPFAADGDGADSTE